jgi:hypothetical protein
VGRLREQLIAVTPQGFQVYGSNSNRPEPTVAAGVAEIFGVVRCSKKMQRRG